MKRIALVLLLLAVALTAVLASNGCSKRYRIEIQSDTCWNGAIDDSQTIYGCGNSSYKVLGAMRCVRMQKSTNAGYLRVRIDKGPWAETTDPLGIVQVCR